MRFEDLLKHNKENREHDSIAIVGARGSGKTTHMNAIAYLFEKAGFKYKICYSINDIPEDLDEFDCIFLDDFASKFNNRDYSTKKNKNFNFLLQEVREVLPMFVTTAPDIYLFDKVIRSMFKPFYIANYGRLVTDTGFSFEVPFLKGFEEFFEKQKAIERTGKIERAKMYVQQMKA
ncbi:hypothetical protein MmarC5_0923 [Methanococcus maripaludis C5]|uniref:Novel STAND NTPase 3 domain-containing protein n=1 Tax=Methanococcus maripaludis (strain C5 / ATCC BAA-1333) TaxID=402880 RepID=A4FYE5_METM5|nr:ATP-binding protein [Methanococcus maripaludis]ABO35229.1 hypothetical protein MmarC5_0923 [Methanococcus maripaludis C5]